MLVKYPAWHSLSPKLPEFIIIDKKELWPLKKILGVDGVFYQVKFDNKLTTAFLFETLISRERFFIKKISNSEKKHYINCEHLTKWIYSEEFLVNSSILNFPDLKDNSIYYVYPYVDGARVQAKTDELILLGRSLAKLHQKIKDYPKKQTIINNTRSKIDQLEQAQKSIILGKYCRIPNFSYVRQIAQKYSFHLIDISNSQILHGDLNPGNLLLSKQKICFFDFEDALHSYLPVIFDLAFIIERIIFTNTNDGSHVLDLGKIFLNAYKDAGGSYEYKRNDEHLLSILSLKAFCLLSMCEVSDDSVLNSEWNKFLKLSNLAEKDKDLLKTILKG
ncbi:TPA: phosphotransferase [Legionella pneumophila]|uniref:phosphotransferase n=1 Tax=Legionella pneumophila TaxID=446 RepID=UPI00048253CB|nr:phosphotransferase [Legionella pneumophila]STX73237.1 serine/threonine protein kinase [Legionella pneumophila]HAT2064643.1 phosphotransferase [Legionella pneumophila]HAT2067239.1 phosphotransferase [Legionella pneumophila]HAT8594049.1 phosphotransferase [Legionella pneumophila]HAT8696833.1 phosphotransferase [Legionella pneumophila]